MATACYLLRNIWLKDPEVRRIFREGRGQMAEWKAATFWPDMKWEITAPGSWEIPNEH
jgi:hypothetical protein